MVPVPQLSTGGTSVSLHYAIDVIPAAGIHLKADPPDQNGFRIAFCVDRSGMTRFVA